MGQKGVNPIAELIDCRPMTGNHESQKIRGKLMLVHLAGRFIGKEQTDEILARPLAPFLDQIQHVGFELERRIVGCARYFRDVPRSNTEKAQEIRRPTLEFFTIRGRNAKIAAVQDASPQSASLPTQGPAQKPRYGYLERHRQQGDATRYPSCLTDAEWALVGDLFENKGPGKPPKYPRRRMVDACSYVVRTGCQWRFLPKDFPAWQDVYAHFRRWTDKGLFETMHDRLRGMWRKRAGRDENPTAMVLDSQSYKTSAQGGPKGFDAAKRVKGRKRHVAVDVLGLLLAILVLPANVQDRDGAPPLVDKTVAKYPTLKKVYVDTAYSGECAQGLHEEHGLDVEVVRRVSKAGAWTAKELASLEQSKQPFPILPRRWVVERSLAWIERPRRLSKDYDRLPEVSEAWAWLAETRLLLTRLTDPAAA